MTDEQREKAAYDHTHQEQFRWRSSMELMVMEHHFLVGWDACEAEANEKLLAQLNAARDAWSRIDRLGNRLEDRQALDRALTVGGLDPREPDRYEQTGE